MISPDKLYDLYIEEKKSVAQIAILLECSQNKVNYWLEKYEIAKRSISDAMYEYKNPDGDPFRLTKPKTLEEGILYGMGLGLYWGEGQKRGDGGMRITNSDPKLLRKFIDFLDNFLNIDKNRLRFSIQIPPDISPNKALKYWSKELNFNEKYFYNPQIIKVRGNGSYKYKTQFGTVIVYLNNIRLKKLICDLIENIQ